MTGALHGIRVLDLSRVLAGPWATQLLADLGAEVIKVERPGEGDDTRRWGPPFASNEDGSARESAYFLSANRGKHSICVDIADVAGQSIIRDLAASADVFVENFKVGALARYSLDYASLHAVNPRLVYCSLTGFGQDGPYAERPGYDFLMQGMGGLMSITGEPGGGPMKVGVALVDVITGLYACNAILAALSHRDRTGRGQHIDVALLDSLVAALANQAASFLVTGENPARLGNAHPSIVPYDVFTSADGHIIIAVGNDAQFRRLCELMESAALADDARFTSNQQRVRHRIELTQLLNERLQRHTSAHWLEQMAAGGVPAGPINHMSEVFSDPQVQHRQLRLDIPHPQLGSVATVACPIRLSDTPVTYDRAPPALGQDTRAVLKRLLRYTDAQIDALRARNVIS